MNLRTRLIKVFQSTFQNSIYEMIDSLSDEELFEPHMRKWADEATGNYPVVGRDTTTNYESIWYLDKEEHNSVKPGEVVQKNI